MEPSYVGILVQAGAVGIALALIGLIWWIVKVNRDRDNKDRLVLTNHLSGLLKDDIESRKQLTIALTTLNNNVNSFGGQCGKVQKDMQETLGSLQATQLGLENGVCQIEKIVKSQSKQ